MALTKRIALASMSRRERKKIETRRRILNAAIDLMQERSFDDVRVEEICERADIANATFFTYFASKSGLIAAFNEQIAEKIVDELAEYSVGGADRLEILRAIMIEEWRANASITRRFIGEAAQRGAVSLLDASQSLYRVAEEIIEDGMSNGDFAKSASASSAALTLIAAWIAVGARWARDGDAARAVEESREVLDFALFGLAPRRH
ncbi:MAG: TetR/AcrR family transcriptional regulator [Pseudomonadota bacterium]